MTQKPDAPLEGGCTCRAVRYRLNAAPLFVHCCHCTWCQRETGSAFAVNALIEATRVETLGLTPEDVLTPSASGRGQAIARCPSCRVAVWSEYAGNRAIRFVRVGTLDDPGRCPPDIHIFTASKRSWVRLPDDTLAVPEFYSYRETWPAASWRRRVAAMEAAGLWTAGGEPIT